MSGFTFNSVMEALSDAQGSGVSFESQAKKWESEEEGWYNIFVK